MQTVLAASRKDAPDLLHVVIGFSLSGNVALLLAAQGLEPRPDGIISVNPPVDIGRVSEDMGKGWSRLYELRFMWRLRRAIRALHGERYSIPLSTTMLEFDDLFTAPECGFESGRDYYRKCSTVHRLSEIETPTVILTAADDPFVDASVFEEANLSPAVFLHVEPSGGHVGYVCTGGLRRWSWLDGALTHYVDELSRARGPRDSSRVGSVRTRRGSG